VQSNSIYLSDLLSPQVSRDVREVAEKIFVGAAPEPGSSRLLSKASIASLFAGVSGLRDVAIPSQIAVRRSGRLVTREDVAAAMHAALDQQLGKDTAVEPKDVGFSATVVVPPGDAQLEVRRIDFDPTLTEVRFVLASRAEPRALPFIATLQLRDIASEVANSGSRTPANATKTTLAADGSSQGSQSDLSKLLELHSAPRTDSRVLPPAAEIIRAPLVEPRKRASLRLSSQTMRMLLDVMPLECGVLGDIVRVKVPGTGAVLHARVVGPGRLEAIF
jgi:hypothetical protein